MTVTVLQPGSSLLVRGLATRVDVAQGAESVSAAILGTVFPDRRNDSAFVATLGRCSRENVANVVEVLAGRLALSEVDARCAREFSALVARLGIPLFDLERSYWIGVERLWQDWFALCRGATAEGTADLPNALGGSTSLLFGYVDRVLDQVVRRYTTVSEEMAASSEDRRRELVMRLLSEQSCPAEEQLDAALGYRMRATHLALVFTENGRRAVSRAVTELRERTDAWGSLLIQADAGTWFGWLGFPDQVDGGRFDRLRKAAARWGGQVAIGEPGRGLAGFRRSNQTAQRTAALRPTLHRPPSCLCASELRLETLLLENPASARQFVRDELGALAEDTERARRIRETLLAWLSSGSQAQAASVLGVHENTVRMRVRIAAEELGAGLGGRRAELLVALRLCAALGPC